MDLAAAFLFFLLFFVWHAQLRQLNTLPLGTLYYILTDLMKEVRCGVEVVFS